MRFQLAETEPANQEAGTELWMEEEVSTNGTSGPACQGRHSGSLLQTFPDLVAHCTPRDEPLLHALPQNTGKPEWKIKISILWKAE